MTVRLMLVVALALGVLTAGCGGTTVDQSESTPATAAPTGAATVLGDLLKDWERQKETMMTIATRCPRTSSGTNPRRRSGVMANR
jgi:hypothetical protein